MATRSVKEELLDVATELAQTMGYNGFSYRDLADRVGVTTATVHYYFRHKDDLGRALIQRYREQSVRDLAPQTLQPEISRFFAQHETWLTNVLADAVEADQIASTIDPSARAKVTFAAIEGAMLAARAFDDPNRLRETGRQLLDQLIDHTTTQTHGS